VASRVLLGLLDGIYNERLYKKNINKIKNVKNVTGVNKKA